MTRSLLPLALVVLLFAGCTSPDAGDDAMDPRSSEGADDEGNVTRTLVFEGSQAWPMNPIETTSMAFEVPGNATELEVAFNWRGQQPGGYSSGRAAVLIDPAGHETELLGGDLPMNPYLCANSVCGPNQDRVFIVQGQVGGHWTVELRGSYTATATVRASVA